MEKVITNEKGITNFSKEKVIIYLSKIKGNWKDIENDIERYNYSGVWSLYGKKQYGNAEWECLEVAETQNIKDEVLAAVNMVVNKNFIGINTSKKFYKFREWSKDFSGRGCNSRYQAKYFDISRNCVQLKIILVEKSDDIKERYISEVKYAIDKKALYWYPAPTNRKRCEKSQWEIVKEMLHPQNIAD